MWLVRYLRKMADVYGTSPKEMLEDFAMNAAMVLTLLSVFVALLVAYSFVHAFYQ